MGKNRSKRRDACLFDSDDDDSFSSASTGISEQTLNQEGDRVTSRESDLDMFLDALYEKRGSTREKALVGLVDAFENHMLHEYVENKSITLFNQFLSSIKRGSSKEAALASRAISLLVLTIGCGSAAHEIMEESVRNLYQALMSGADSLKKSSILDCLAIVCFVGGEEVEEKEKAMKIIWELIHPKSGANVTLSKPNPVVLASAISAWTFILSTLNPRHMSSQTWRDSISYLSTLLEKEDRAVRIASGEAIALMFELGRLDKFSQEEKSTEGGFTYVETLKWKILGQARALSMEAGGKGTAKGDLNSQRSTFQDIVTFIETGSCPEHSMKISNNCNHLVVSSWTRMTQLHFLKRFLGRGFLKHVQENELLHDVFNFTPKKKDNLTVMEKRLFQSPNSMISKERTQYLNKKRTLTKDWKQGHFKVGAEDS